jgi:hypothetical protein
MIEASLAHNSLGAGIRSILVTAGSIARNLPLLVSERPRTPLRILCIMAFDFLHMLRSARPMTSTTRRTLAALLDLGACANAALDRKRSGPDSACRTLRMLEQAGIGLPVDEYRRRLGHLEAHRPLPGGDARRFHKVRAYRESVVRLSLEMLAATADGSPCPKDSIRTTNCDAGLDLLFRMAMQCQVIDDVLDYSEDLSGALPSFLTASRSLPEAFELTRNASLAYADLRGRPRTPDLLPLRIALFLLSTCTNLVMALGRWRHLGRVNGQRRRGLSARFEPAGASTRFVVPRRMGRSLLPVGP